MAWHNYDDIMVTLSRKGDQEVHDTMVIVVQNGKTSLYSLRTIQVVQDVEIIKELLNT